MKGENESKGRERRTRRRHEWREEKGHGEVESTREARAGEMQSMEEEEGTTLKGEEMQHGVTVREWREHRCEGETLVGRLGHQSIDARRRSTCQRARR